MPRQPTCPIDNSRMREIFQQRILLKYDVAYYHCEQCGHIRTEEPYWLDQAYTSAISSLDTGILHRNFRTRLYLEPLIELLNAGDEKFADIGGGYGILTRLMRDIGYDCKTSDPYCENIFAKEFEVSADEQYGILFAFEVLEHIINPVKFLESAFSTYRTKTLVFSTLTYASIPEKSWWYYAAESGQHVSFYQKRTLADLAKKMGCTYYSVNDSFHVITDRRLSLVQKLLLRIKALYAIYAVLVRIHRVKRTKIFEDHDRISSTLSSTSPGARS